MCPSEVFNGYSKGLKYVVNVSETQRSERGFKVFIGAHSSAGVVRLASEGKKEQGAAQERIRAVLGGESECKLGITRYCICN